MTGTGRRHRLGTVHDRRRRVDDSPDHHLGAGHLHPLVDVLVEPDDADGVAAVQIAVVAVLVPPAGRVELGAVRAAHVVVAVDGAERHPIRVLERVRGVPVILPDRQLVVRRLVADFNGAVLGLPELIGEGRHLDAERVRVLARHRVKVLESDPEVGVEIAEPVAVLPPGAIERLRAVHSALDDCPAARVVELATHTLRPLASIWLDQVLAATVVHDALPDLRAVWKVSENIDTIQ